MIKGFKPIAIHNYVLNELKTELLDSDNNLTLSEEDIIQLTKTKKVSNAHNRFLKEKYNIYDIGYSGVIYKIGIAVLKENNKKFCLIGYLDAGSKYPVILTNIELNEKQKEYINIIKENGGLGIGHAKYTGISALLQAIHYDIFLE